MMQSFYVALYNIENTEYLIKLPMNYLQNTVYFLQPVLVYKLKM